MHRIGVCMAEIAGARCAGATDINGTAVDQAIGDNRSTQCAGVRTYGMACADPKVSVDGTAARNPTTLLFGF